MAYYLGRDVKVVIATEADQYVYVASNAVNRTGTAAQRVAVALADASDFDSTAAGNVTDVVGVDLGIGVTDEDITYMGQRQILKAEIKKETTVSLTLKKANAHYDVMFNGPTAGSAAYDDSGKHGARWGIRYNSTATQHEISDGLANPKDHTDSTATNCTYGYRVFIVMKQGTEVIAVPNCTMTGHTVSLNADGTTEETIEFMSNIAPIIGATLAACETQTTCANM
jgi:hypothetical protein